MTFTNNYLLYLKNASKLIKAATAPGNTALLDTEGIVTGLQADIEQLAVSRNRTDTQECWLAR